MATRTTSGVKLTMTNRPEQQQINQYIKWLVYSAPKTTALVPCTTYAWVDWLMRGTDETIVAKFCRSDYWKVNLTHRFIEIVDRGRLVFTVPRQDRLSGRLWDKIFRISGPRPTALEHLDIMEALDRARLREENTCN